MEYKVVFVINGERKTLILEHIKEEYGVSEQEFWSCWLLDKKHICGDGDTPEKAIEAMIKQKESVELMRRLFNESIEKSITQFKTPIINDRIETLSHALAYQNFQLARMTRNVLVSGL